MSDFSDTRTVERSTRRVERGKFSSGRERERQRKRKERVREEIEREREDKMERERERYVSIKK